MMQRISASGRILAHRGLWHDPSEANSPEALIRALSEGFGIETDLRDLDGSIVVSHDPPSGFAPAFAQLLREWRATGHTRGRFFALNVKADGLVSLLSSFRPLLSGLQHYFFDMSFPQLRLYVGAEYPVAFRVSEYEPISAGTIERLGADCRFWLDGFESDWWLNDSAINRLCDFAYVAVVSPEIHGRDPRNVWEWYANKVAGGCDVSICTDRPYDVLEVVS